MRNWGKAALPLVVGLVVAGCAIFSAGPITVEAGKPAPEIERTDSNGEPFYLEEYKGRVVLLHFWHMA
jgi:hypothetical protein